MNQSELKRVCIHPKNPRDSKKFSNKGFVDIDKDRIGGSHCICFIIKDNKFYYFVSFGGQPHTYLLNQLTKPILYHNYKVQDIKYKLCGSYCLYFMYLIEKMKYLDAILKLYFGLKNVNE